jgi:hypothetical protein
MAIICSEIFTGNQLLEDRFGLQLFRDLSLLARVDVKSDISACFIVSTEDAVGCSSADC